MVEVGEASRSNFEEAAGLDLQMVDCQETSHMMSVLVMGNRSQMQPLSGQADQSP